MHKHQINTKQAPRSQAANSPENLGVTRPCTHCRILLYSIQGTVIRRQAVGHSLEKGGDSDCGKAISALCMRGVHALHTDHIREMTALPWQSMRSFLDLLTCSGWPSADRALFYTQYTRPERDCQAVQQGGFLLLSDRAYSPLSRLTCSSMARPIKPFRLSPRCAAWACSSVLQPLGSVRFTRS